MIVTVHRPDEYICPTGFVKKRIKPATGYSYVTERQFEQYVWALPLGRYFIEGYSSTPVLVHRTRGRYTERVPLQKPNSAPAPVEMELNNDH